MRAVQIKGGASTSAKDLYIADNVDKPVLKDGEMLVKVKAFGLNRGDIMQRKGEYPPPPGISSILGLEFSGIVEEPAGKWKKGDKVCGLVKGGAYAEYVAARSEMCLELGDLSWEQGAALCETYLTAYQGLRLITEIQPNETVLIHAAASGVGLSAIYLAHKIANAKIICTAGSKEKIEFLSKKPGVIRAINYKEEDWEAIVKELTNQRGVDVVLDPVAKDYFAKNIRSMAIDGRLSLYGGLSGTIVDELNLGPILFKRLRIQGTTLRARSPEYQANLLQKFKDEALEGVRQVGPEIYKTFSWKDIVEITEVMEADKNIGKLVCLVDDN